MSAAVAVRPQTPTVAPHTTSPESGSEVMLPLTVRHADGSERTVQLPSVRHRQIHLGVLHSMTNGYVEIAAGYRDKRGKLKIYTRDDEEYFLPGGATGNLQWRDPLLALAERHHSKGEDVFVGVTPRAARRATQEDIHWTRSLWMDIDDPGHAEQIDELLQAFPAHLEIASAGGDGDERSDGHRHLVWLLSAPQVARTVADLDSGEVFHNAKEVTQGTGKRGRPRIVGYRDRKTRRLLTNVEAVDWIERWNYRLIHRLGYSETDGKKTYFGDVVCRERSRVLRLAGTINHKTGRYARIARLDLALAPYNVNTLIGGLPDPPRSRPIRRRDLRDHAYDPYRLIPAAAYFPVLAGVEVPGKGNMGCPSPAHPDENPSCSVSEYVFHCFGCGAQGTIYDLASLMRGGPTGDALAADETVFHSVAEEVRERCRHLI